jgi:hypothetical protein
VLAWWLTGPVDTDALRAALRDVHRRHETLHCRYLGQPEPVAVVPVEPGEPEFTVCAGQPDEATVEAGLDQFIAAPLELAAGKVWRAGLVPVASTGRNLLALGIHHVAFDGWSQALLVADLEHAYRARIAGVEPVWERPAPTLAALAAEEAQRLAGADLSAQQAYWRDVLRRVTRLDLPGAARGPIAPRGPKVGARAWVPAAVLDEWDGAARAARVTPFGYLVAVFAHLLRELSGQRDVAMLVPVAARGTPVLDAAIAARLDAVCLRLPGTPGDPVAQAGAVLANALAHQDLPFAAAVADIALLRPDLHVLAGLPVFLLQDNVSRPFELTGCAAEGVDSPVAREAPNALTVEVFRDSAGATVRVTIRTDRLPAALAGRIADGFPRILCAGTEALREPVPR